MSTTVRSLAILLSILGAIFLTSLTYETNLFGLIPKSLSDHARAVIATCGKENYPPACYDREIPRLMDQGLTMEEAFEVTRLIQNQVDNYFYCHVLGHNLSAKEAAKDPQAWTDVVARCPTGMCSNGCLHGAAQERFRDDVLTDTQIDELIPTLSTICEREDGRVFTFLERSSCYHSLGHLTMYISGANADTAVRVCDAIAKKDMRDHTQTCYEGAFMQIFQPLEPEDFALVKDIPATTTTSAAAFCDSYTGERKSACYRESWPLYRETFDTPGALESFCSLVPGAERQCYNAMFYVLSAQYNFEEDRIVALCDSLPEKRMAQCFGNVAARFLETDYRLIPGAVHMCELAEERGVGPRCYDELLFYSSFTFHRDSAEFMTLCRALPEPWQTQCVNHEGGSVDPSRNDG